MAGTQKVAVRLNLYNALNANTVIENSTLGSGFLRPRAIIAAPPRGGERDVHLLARLSAT